MREVYLPVKLLLCGPISCLAGLQVDLAAQTGGNIATTVKDEVITTPNVSSPSPSRLLLTFLALVSRLPFLSKCALKAMLQSHGSGNVGLGARNLAACLGHMRIVIA